MASFICCTGLVSMVFAVYIAEMAPAETRGVLVNIFTLFTTVGLLVSGVVGGLLGGIRNGWRYVFDRELSRLNDNYVIVPAEKAPTNFT